MKRMIPVCVLLLLACAGAAKAGSFTTGEFVTYDESAWTNISTAIALLNNDFTSVYPTSIVTVGLPNGGFTMRFDQPSPVLLYLPASGSPGALTANVLDPITTPAGSFGGDVLALKFNVDFNNAGFLVGTSAIPFGSLVLTNLSTCSQLDGLTLNQFLAIDNTALGGGSTTCSIANLDAISASVDASFDLGSISTFAQENLTLPTSPVPEPSSLLLLGPALAGLGLLPRRSGRERRRR